jgi:hypothetical protein
MPGPAGLPALTDSVATSLKAMRSAQGLVLLADDSQDLDEASSGLLQQLVTAGVMVAILTARSGIPLPTPLTGLWAEGSVEQIELQNLSQKETSELLAAALGGSVEDTSAKRIWHVTSGNPLYLREVLLASAETGALREVGTEWRWRGEWAKGARLQHSLHAEVLRATIPGLRQRSIHQNLIDALHATGARRAADRVRLASWSLESGVDVVVITLSLGAGGLFGIGPAFSARLKQPGDTAAGAVVADAGDGAVEIVHHRHAHLDPMEAVRLAQAAYDRTGAVSEGLALVRAVAWTGATERAESVVAELAGNAKGVDDQLPGRPGSRLCPLPGAVRHRRSCSGPDRSGRDRAGKRQPGAGRRDLRAAGGDRFNYGEAGARP